MCWTCNERVDIVRMQGTHNPVCVHAHHGGMMSIVWCCTVKACCLWSFLRASVHSTAWCEASPMLLLRCELRDPLCCQRLLCCAVRVRPMLQLACRSFAAGALPLLIWQRSSVAFASLARTSLAFAFVLSTGQPHRNCNCNCTSGFLPLYS